MNFFAAQEHARTKTRRLVFLFALAILAISFGVNVLVVFGRAFLEGGAIDDFSDFADYWELDDTLITLGIVVCTVGGGSLFKWLELRAGGHVIAKMMGGELVEPCATDAAKRRLLNIVEEMSIAAGMPVPPVFILSREGSINAFAAGLTTGDAVVAVSQGALDKLSRDELQAVVGHEFSHILNGDMRLNLKLTAILFGIIAFTLIGRVLLHAASRSGRSRNKNNSAAILLVGGLALIVLGYAGFFFGRLIQAAISRQREFLADASSVQFTRNPAAMAGALNTIRLTTGSRIQEPRASEISHMFFAQSFSGLFSQMFATHPPLETRIKAVVANFDLNAPLSSRPLSTASRNEKGAARVRRRDVNNFMDSVGALGLDGIQQAQTLISRLPGTLHTAAHNASACETILLGLLLDRSPDIRARQARALAGISLDAALLAELRSLEPHQRLPLLQISLGTLRAIPSEQQDVLLARAQALVNADGRVSIFEYALLSLLKHQIARQRKPRQAARVMHLPVKALAEATGSILSFVAYAGNTSPAAAGAAYAAGARTLAPHIGLPPILSSNECNFRCLDAALNALACTRPEVKQQTLQAASTVASADNIIQPDEAELLRVIASALDCPVSLL
ncbi:MAG: M48 family metallopeptidase [Puniceicoccales bacterium]|jgi:Zn-dependent protease with chaperone function|nr:M48 family metallopeptidase [Puniceicoccales bacterium]